MTLAELAARVWYGDGAGAGAARAALLPAALLFRAGAAARSALYDAGLARVHALPLPAVSVGNLTVGGTGKTPVAAWLVGRLLAHGARPAIVLRGVGDDETRVHALLNPAAPVIAAADRVAGAREARARGADVVVLDDAFQHRRAARDADVVLLSAEHAHAAPRLLPAGPYRELPAALSRATAVVVTRKSAGAQEAAGLLARVQARHPGLPGAVVHLAPDALRRWGVQADHGGDGVRALGALRGARVLAIAGVGEPAAFAAQLEGAGATVTVAAFPDHHAYDAHDAARLAHRARACDLAICTLKDAVKLGPLWPRPAPPLWYVSQRVAAERGEEVLEDLVRRLLARRATAHVAGAGDDAPGRTTPAAAGPRAVGTEPAGPVRPE